MSEEMIKDTLRLFDQDARRISFTGTVLSCEPDKKQYKIVLDQTLFFPEEGGQTCDKGTMNGIKVEKVLEKNHVIYHWMKTPLEVGSTVSGQIDWDKRFNDMQQHSGEHIVSGTIHRRFGYDNVGFHLGSDDVTMDFNGPLTQEELRSVELEANKAVFSNIPILVSFPSEEELQTISYRSKKELEGQVRIVEIPGYDICACCAPHVAATGEIGLIKLVQMENYKGGVRIHMLCGYRALSDYQVKETSVREISGLLSAKPDAISQAVARQKEELLNVRQHANEMNTELLMLSLEKLPDHLRHVAFFDNHMDKNNVKRVWNVLTEKYDGLVGCFYGNDERGYSVMLGSKILNVKEESSKLFAAFGGRGGGNQELVQGNVKAARAAIETYFASLK